MEEYADKVYARGALPLYGFDIDSGMKPEKILPGEIGITFDLAALNIPEEAWDDINIMRLDPGGNLVELKTTRSGSRITCYERHNGIFMAVLMGFALGLPVVVGLEQSDKFKGEDWNSYSSENFRVFWPKSMQPPNPQEVERARKELKTIWNDLYLQYLARKNIKRAQIIPTPLFMEETLETAEKVMLWVEFETDPRTRKLKELVSSEDWLKKNFIPVQVVSGLEVLERSYRYLTGTEAGQRGFKGATFKIDVLFRQQWSYGPDILAMSVANHFIYPYIDLNLAGIPQKPLDTSGDFDDLYTTVVHEVFHCLQTRYYSPKQAYTWFEEATAVTLEGEAGSYFLDKGWVKKVFRTDRAHLYDAFLRPMDFSQADNEILRRHGYGQSYFVEYFRDKYYLGKEASKFLPRLMDTFSGWLSGGWLSGTTDSLYKATSGKPAQLGKDFAVFCEESRSNIVSAFKVNPVSITLGSANPIFKWDFKGAPLSCEFRQLIIPDTRPSGTPDRFKGIDTRPGVIIKGVPEDDKLLSYYSHSAFDKTWRKLGPDGVFMTLKEKRKNTNQYEIWLQRIHAYVEEPEDTSYKNVVVVMHTPPAITAEKPKKGRIMLHWQQSPLKHHGLVGSYRVLVWGPNSKEDKPFIIDTDKNQAELVLKDVLGKYKAKKDDYLEVVYREKLITKTTVFGPPSQVIRIKIPADDFGGIWIR